MNDDIETDESSSDEGIRWWGAFDEGVRSVEFRLKVFWLLAGIFIGLMWRL